MKNIKTQKNKTATFQLRCFASVIEGRGVGGGGIAEIRERERGGLGRRGRNQEG